MIAGVSLKKINESLQKFELSLDKIDGILIKHEHSDHTHALGTISKNTIFQYILIKKLLQL